MLLSPHTASVFTGRRPAVVKVCSLVVTSHLHQVHELFSEPLPARFGRSTRILKLSDVQLKSNTQIGKRP